MMFTANPIKLVIKMLKIDDISVSYRIKGKKVPVLQNFSLQLQQGEVLAVLVA